jgi:hypothetical protein
MSELCACAESFLLSVYDEEEGLFPFSTRLQGGKFVNDYSHPHTVRYSINSLLGLRREAQFNPHAQVSVTEVDRMVDRFLDRQYRAIRSPADFGLLSLLLADRGPAPELERTLHKLGEVAAEPSALRRLSLQDLSWILWGTTSAAQRKLAGAARIAHDVFSVVRNDFVDASSGLATHRRSLYRRGLVSFGSTVYFLRSSYEYSRFAGDPYAHQLFSDGVQKMIDVQGPSGEWPWLLRVRTATPIQFYPVFSVHQDSMAMLFLLPALDDGMNGVRRAVNRSFAWALGRNELGVPMLWSEPYFAYRSVERTDMFPRLQRYLRATCNVALGQQDGPAHGTGVRLNPECRSYHLGWILYAWAGRSDVPGTEGQRLRALTAAG